MNASNEGAKSAIMKAAYALSEQYNTDIYVYSGAVTRGDADSFRKCCCAKAESDNAILIFSTYGGDADSAYRIARCLQNRYSKGKISVLIDGMCKSAGTLLILGADEVIMSEKAELGPLDVQLQKPDELGEMTSGLTPMQALSALRAESFRTFEQFFLDIRIKSNLQITTKSAAEIATQLTTGLFAPMYAQIDPLRVGEIDRAVKIAVEYGEKLDRGNLKSDALERLIGDYPSHSFVIDFDEARSLFKNIRGLSREEETLVMLLRQLIENPHHFEATIIPLSNVARQEAAAEESLANIEGVLGDVEGEVSEGGPDEEADRPEIGSGDGADQPADVGNIAIHPSTDRGSRDVAGETR